MASFMTLQAYCEGCQGSIDVYADELFEFDCKCRECGGVLVLQEDGSADEADDDMVFFDEATREDDREDGDAYLGGDRPTTADSEDDPYAAAAMALDPAGSGRYSRERLEGIREAEDEPQESLSDSGLFGMLAESPPLPSWDGGDTQQVQALAKDEPPATGALAPLDVSEDNALGDLVEVVQVAESTSGRGSRTYDAGQLVAEISDEGPAEAKPVSSLDIPTPAPKEEPKAKKNGSSTTQTLFGEDLDWLALIDDRLPDSGEEDEDGAGRVFIRLPEGAAPGPEGDAAQVEQLQKTMETLESGGPSSLGSLIWSIGGADTRNEPSVGSDGDDEPDTDTRRYMPGDDKSQLAGQPTMAHGVLPGEDETGEDARPTKAHPKKLETKKWAAAFAQERPPGEDDDGGPTKAWGGHKEPVDQPTQNWRGKQPVPKVDMPTRGWEASSGTPPPAASPAAADAPSSRHLRRGDGVRVIDKFRRQDLDPALICARDVSSPEADYFRQLYQQVFQARNGSSPRVVLVTSPRRGEGKTTIAANLAIAAARVPGKGVVLVDADPRGAGVLRAFGERSPMEGLLEALETGSEPSRYVVQFNLGHMDVVPLGIRGSNAAELIASDHMGDFLRGLRVHYPDWPIIVDSSSCLHSADPLNLSQHVDGVVLVVRAGGTQEDEVTRVTELLGRKRVLGVVLNDAKGI